HFGDMQSAGAVSRGQYPPLIHEIAQFDGAAPNPRTPRTGDDNLLFLEYDVLLQVVMRFLRAGLAHDEIDLALTQLVIKCCTARRLRHPERQSRVTDQKSIDDSGKYPGQHRISAANS